MSNYDVIVIGAGPAGYVCAIRAAQLGLKTAIVEKEWLGGVCLNVGCIPSKALLKNAEVALILRQGSKEFGFTCENLNLDFSTAVKRSQRVANRLTRGVSYLMQKNNITILMGEAHLTARDTVVVSNPTEKTTTLRAPHIVLATGAKAATIPGVELDGQRVLTYRQAILQEKLPDSVVIIGAGAIGVEFATIWNAYGAEVTLVEMLPRLLPLEDEEVGAELSKAFTKRGIKVLAGHKVEGVETRKENIAVTVSSAEERKTISADQALVAIGFKPNSAGLGLEGLGVELTPQKAIAIDERMATNIPGIWAIGDVTAKLMLAHVGSAQGIVCAENIAGVETLKLNYEMMPRATYCQPQVASFGLTEARAQERGLEVKVGKFPFQANGKALGSGDYSGWVKIIADAQDGKLLGAHMIGSEVTELLPELTLAQRLGGAVEDIARNVHAHPTLSEVLMEVAHVIAGTPIHM
ncbi:MAG: dihydrolipoyl dehydrogenase [Chloroflexota bacterium]